MTCRKVWGTIICMVFVILVLLYVVSDQMVRFHQLNAKYYDLLAEKHAASIAVTEDDIVEQRLRLK